MTEFEYNTRAFESLALPDEQKTMLSSLVRAHTAELQFDDLVKGKGKGLIFLLHGEPGVGKTLTAGKDARRATAQEDTDGCGREFE